MCALLIITLSIIFIALLFFFLGYRTWSRRKRPPGPWGLPIIGHLLRIDPLHPYETLTVFGKKYGEIFSLQFGTIYTVVLTNPKTIKSLFMRDITTGRAPLFLTHGIMKGYGIICSEGALWKDQRKFVHGFLKQLGASKVGQQRNKLESFVKEFVLEVLEKIDIYDSGEPICPMKILSHSLGSLINKIVFGRSWPEDDPTWIWLQKMQEDGVQLMGVAGPLNFLPYMRFIPKYKNIMKYLTDGQSKTHELYRKIIKDEMDRMESELNIAAEGPNNLIQAFLMERQQRSADIVENIYNEKQLLHLLADIFGASLDTTLGTMRWYLLYITKYQDIQNKVRKEIQDILQGREPCLEDINHMPLFEATLCEIFRIRPVVPVGIPHGALQDMRIGDYEIPKGTMIIPLIWAIHMNDEIWEKPEDFNPFRFIDEEGKLIKSENLMPFQAGKRMCVGEEFAKIMLFLYLTSILQKYRIELVDSADVDLTGVCGLTMSPKPYKLLFHKVF